MPRKSIRLERDCLQCGAKMLVTVSTLAEGRGRVCSKACMYDSRRGPRGPRHSEERRIAMFWARADRTGGAHACWPWTGVIMGGRHRRGYANWNGKTRIAARVAWEITHGPIPGDLLLCHNCPGGDNSLCINPAHLWLGTAADNSRDASAKGRTNQGIRSSTARLTDD